MDRRDLETLIEASNYLGAIFERTLHANNALTSSDRQQALESLAGFTGAMGKAAYTGRLGERLKEIAEKHEPQGARL